MANELDAREELAPLVAIARKDAEIIRPDYGGPRIYVFLQPENKYYSLPRVKTARQLLQAFNLEEESALVARGNELLTPDRHISPSEEILLRSAGSRG